MRERGGRSGLLNVGCICDLICCELVVALVIAVAAVALVIAMLVCASSGLSLGG